MVSFLSKKAKTDSVTEVVNNTSSSGTTPRKRNVLRSFSKKQSKETTGSRGKKEDVKGESDMGGLDERETDDGKKGFLKGLIGGNKMTQDIASSEKNLPEDRESAPVGEDEDNAKKNAGIFSCIRKDGNISSSQEGTHIEVVYKEYGEDPLEVMKLVLYDEIPVPTSSDEVVVKVQVSSCELR